MRTIKIILGTGAALYSAAALVQLGYKLATANPASAYGVADIAAGVIPLCLGIAASWALLQSALKQPITPSDKKGRNER